MTLKRAGTILARPGGGGGGGTATLIFGDSFTGTDGAAPSATYWTTGRTGTGASAVINGNRLRLTTGTTGGFASTDVVARRYVNNLSDFDMTFTWTPSSGGPFFAAGFRGDQATIDFGTGYYFEIQPDKIQFVKTVGYVYSNLGILAGTYSNGTTYKVRLYASGSALKAKAWNAINAEPSSWMLEAADSAVATGIFGFSVSGATPSSVGYIDDVVCNTIGTGTGGGTVGGGGGGGGGGGNTSGKMFGIWHHSWTGPLLRDYPSNVKANLTDVMLGIGQGNGDGNFSYSSMRGTGFNNQSHADQKTDVQNFIAAGINVSLGVGGSNGGVRCLTATHASQFVASAQNAVATFGINGINLDIESGDWNATYLASACMQLRSIYGTGFKIQVTTSMWGPYTAAWMNFLNVLGHANYDWTGPMLYDYIDATDSRLNAWSVARCDDMIAAGVPQEKMTIGYMLQPYAGYAASPNITVINNAYNAVKAKYPNVRGMWLWEDGIDQDRGWEWSLGSRATVG